MTPLVSILLPAKNPGRFLSERLDSIFAQSLTDWELIIVDSASTDGSREIFEELTRKDARVTLYERPPGLYAAWNFAIQKAQGEFVYVATADDTMELDALEKFAAVLQEHPECDFCDSQLQLIDADGKVIPEFAPQYAPHRWHLAYPLYAKHVRRHPADFFVHLGGKTVYTSITQLLIRRSFFEKTGLFPEDYGNAADYLWGLRAALYGNVIYLPERLASWRIHAEQATNDRDSGCANQRFLMEEMAQKALQEALPDVAVAGAKLTRLAHFKGILLPAKKMHCSVFRKLGLLGKALCQTPLLTLEFLLTMPWYLWRIPLNFVFIYTYDRMIYRHTKRFYRGKIELCEPDAQ